MTYGKLEVLPGAAGLPGCCRVLPGAAGRCRVLPGTCLPGARTSSRLSFGTPSNTATAVSSQGVPQAARRRLRAQVR